MWYFQKMRIATNEVPDKPSERVKEKGRAVKSERAREWKYQQFFFVKWMIRPNIYNSERDYLEWIELIKDIEL